MAPEFKCFKLDEDDILEILVEHFQDQYKNLDCAKGVILGTPTKDLRFVVVLGKECDNALKNIDLQNVDNTIEFNGFHAFLRKHPECYLSKTGDGLREP